MAIGSYIAIYLVVWWTVLFAVLPWGAHSQRQVGPLECTSARKADSGTHGGGGAGKVLKKIQAWLSIRRQGVRRR